MQVFARTLILLAVTFTPFRHRPALMPFVPRVALIDWPLTDWCDALADEPTRALGGIGDMTNALADRCGRVTIDGIRCSREHSQRTVHIAAGGVSNSLSTWGNISMCLCCIDLFLSSLLCAVYEAT